MYQPLLRIVLRRKAHPFVYPHPQGLLIPNKPKKTIATLLLGEAYPWDPSKWDEVLDWLDSESKIANCKGRRGLLLQPPEEVKTLILQSMDSRPEFNLTKELTISSFIESALSRRLHCEAIRVCRNSLVISETHYGTIMDRYKAYLQKRYGYAKKKARRLRDKLQGLFCEGTYYLVNGDFCMRGRVLKLRSHYLGIDLFEREDGDLLEYEDNFLWQDPDFQTLANFRYQHTRSRYGKAYIKVQGKEYRVTKHAFKQWHKRAAGHYGKANKQDRLASLEHLIVVLQKTEQVYKKRSKNRVKMYLKHKNEAEYLTTDGWIFVVVDDDNALTTCYHVGDVSNGFTRTLD